MYGAWSRNNGGHNAVGHVVSDCFTLNRPPQLPKRSGVVHGRVACPSLLLAIFTAASRMRRSCILTPDVHPMR